MKAAYIVRISVPAREFRAALAGVPGAALVRELPRDQVVVVLERAAARALACLPGVVAVREDRPEHLLERPGDA
ncbi:hypothetical protein [Sphaerisporangium sp. TRM90804]|uniref:hypothetical protein n=1 Tax=Sphaerisporangium sp. TRM90804 TaxID=3031113 RepID=UPI00244A1A45|nr:hypothetical protein [Sphaerisporangium sp. TRM90804]MDH2428506.1 hypothetical protein [Sphaerisporangium sp. TRM90804]